MHLGTLDIAIIILYIVLVFAIALDAGSFMKMNLRAKNKEGLTYAQNHYLAGKSITFWEALLSMVATEFSALAFLAIPTYVYFENLNALRFIIGACLSRACIALFFLPKMYNQGLTIFEVLARGKQSGGSIGPGEKSGQKFFAFFYFVTKIVGVGIRLLGGAILVAQLLDFSLFLTIIMIAVMTYLYVILGGLKAVVRTDMIQAGIFILGGVVAHIAVANLGHSSWMTLFSFGFEHGKLSLFGPGQGLAFAYGILAGIAYDAATHGVDQDFAQKLLGAKDMATAKKAVGWSAVGTLAVNLLFLTLGVILWSHYTIQGQPLPGADKMFFTVIVDYFPSPMKGLMVASILAACMSTLDSAINALSACFWNDLMSVEKTRSVRMYINLDNFIITVAIVIVAYLFSFSNQFADLGLYFGCLCAAPLLAFFIHRMLLPSHFTTDYSPALITISSVVSCAAMSVSHFRFELDVQVTILVGLLASSAFMYLYSKIGLLFEERQEPTS